MKFDKDAKMTYGNGKREKWCRGSNEETEGKKEKDNSGINKAARRI